MVIIYLYLNSTIKNGIIYILMDYSLVFISVDGNHCLIAS